LFLRNYIVLHMYAAQGLRLREQLQQKRPLQKIVTIQMILISELDASEAEDHSLLAEIRQAKLHLLVAGRNQHHRHLPMVPSLLRRSC
jgi:hypothetical protein